MARTGAGAAYVALVEDSAPAGLRTLKAAVERPAEAAEGAGTELEEALVEDEEPGANDAGVARPPARMLQVQGPVNLSSQMKP